MAMGHYDKQRPRKRPYERRRDERSVPESPEDRLTNAFLRFGSNPSSDLSLEIDSMTSYLTDGLKNLPDAVFNAYRICITQIPHKIQCAAVIFKALGTSPDDQADASLSPETQGLRRKLFDNICKCFQTALSDLKWRDIRMHIHFFAYLCHLEVIDTESFLSLLRSFLSVLEEPGLSSTRCHQAAQCVGEGLIISSCRFLTLKADGFHEVVQSLISCLGHEDMRAQLCYPNSASTEENIVYLQQLKIIVENLRTEQAQASLISFFPASSFEKKGSGLSESLELPSYMVPPEPEDISMNEAERHRLVSFPDVRIRLFNEAVPPSGDPIGLLIRSLILDISHIFEVNRKECATILLELPRWFEEAVWKQKKAGFPSNPASNRSDWSLENTLLEVLIQDLSLLPNPQLPPIYHAALISEMCKLSPETVGPAVGKSIRQLYSMTGRGLDIEVSRRVSEWFATHLSNFSFNWVWKEWIPDIDLPLYHPKKSFIQKSIAIEIRLAYQERVEKTLPEAFLHEGAFCVPQSTEASNFEYENPRHPLHVPAQSLLNLIRNREAASDVQAHLQNVQLTELDDTLREEAGVSLRMMTLQVLLHVGSRSISHLLNALERYLPVLRELLPSGQDTVVKSDARKDFLRAAAKFWSTHTQMICIVFDKLVQYQLVDPADVISWSFEVLNDAEEHFDYLKWEILKAAVDKAIGRVHISRSRIAALEKTEDDLNAQMLSSQADETDDPASSDLLHPLKSQMDSTHTQLMTARKASSILEIEQKEVLAAVLSGFCDVFSHNDGADFAATHLHTDTPDWSKAQWKAWLVYSWFVHFVRQYAGYLAKYRITFENTALVPIMTTTDSSLHGRLKDVWTLALSQS